MPKITVDDVDYNSEDLTDNGKAQLASLQFLEVQMRKLQNEISVYQTARNAYVAALKAELAKASWSDQSYDGGGGALRPNSGGYFNDPGLKLSLMRLGLKALVLR